MKDNRSNNGYFLGREVIMALFFGGEGEREKERDDFFIDILLFVILSRL